MNNNAQHYINNYPLESNKYMFLIEKECGYKWLVVIHKKLTLSDLYKHIEIDMELFNGFKLFTINKNLIPRSLERINDYVIGNVGDFKPEFNLPDPVIYKIKIDYFHKDS